jgi:hypothetical protein
MKCYTDINIRALYADDELVFYPSRTGDIDWELASISVDNYTYATTAKELIEHSTHIYDVEEDTIKEFDKTTMSRYFGTDDICFKSNDFAILLTKGSICIGSPNLFWRGTWDEEEIDDADDDDYYVTPPLTCMEKAWLETFGNTGARHIKAWGIIYC